ncbi:PaaI family thioesterase [Caulobacter sp. CCUG 60055]|uniref:PaaI family thioesterase n=1 Tax=Caulobacter sp. CCUG 60055 TaxID=2100090 RepID=UPI001FA767DE|nr:PaaI family thioesterase [Caulobacteraceae bacterium]MCI3178997.1 PaaI family thioesterase [Caulobacter sp. CCUG 60055]
MADAAEVPAPPPGFLPSPSRGPFSAHNGPFFDREADEGFQRAFYALKRHCNGLGLVHGGMLTSFLDSLLAAAVHRATGAACVTIHLSVDFLSMARAGEWVIGEARLTRAARDTAFAEGRAMIAGRDVVRASGVFKLMPRRARERVG